MKYVFLTDAAVDNECWIGSYVEVVKDDSDSETVEVRFSDGTVATVKRTELYDPDMVPFKVGDEVKNLYGFTTYCGSWVWSGIRWTIKRVMYSLPNLKVAALVCDSAEMGLKNAMFMSDNVEKI